jgi:hypothetical protein
MMFFVGRVDTTVRGAGWMMIGGPIAVATLAMAASYVAVRPAALEERSGGSVRPMRRVAVHSIGAGAILLLLSAAHDLTLWAGQCAFAMGAVLLWMNTPDSHVDAGEPRESSSVRQAGVGMTIALACAVGQGAASMMSGPGTAGISGAMMLAAAAMAVAAAARLAGPAHATRIGLWAATYGVLLGLGMLSIKRLVPSAWEVVETGETLPIGRVVSGFGAYAYEAVALMMAGAGAVLQHGLSAPIQRALGGGILVGTAILIGLRISGI